MGSARDHWEISASVGWGPSGPPQHASFSGYRFLNWLGQPACWCTPADGGAPLAAAARLETSPAARRPWLDLASTAVVSGRRFLFTSLVLTFVLAPGAHSQGGKTLLNNALAKIDSYKSQHRD